MLTKTIFILALVATALAGVAEDKKEVVKAEETSKPAAPKDKRGLLGFGYGFDSGITSYSSDFGVASYPVHSTVITKEVGVPVPHPVAVPVDRPVPYAVKVPYAVPVDRPYPVSVPKPYPVEVTKHVPVPVDRPVPYAVGVPYKVPVPAPYPVHVPAPYAVPVVKHVPVHVSEPVVVEKYTSFPSSGWSAARTSW